MIRLAIIIAIIVGGTAVVAAIEWRSRRHASGGSRLDIRVRQVPPQPRLGWLARRPHTGHVRQAEAGFDRHVTEALAVVRGCQWCADDDAPSPDRDHSWQYKPCTCDGNCGHEFCLQGPFGWQGTP